MKKDFIYSIIIGFSLFLMFQACQEDPIFPDPGFEIEDQRVEVRRDTADYYDINMKMDVPNGVNEILLLNALDYNTLETIEGYTNQSKFDFTYSVDLTPFEKDTVLNYIIKVTDNDRRTFNRGIRISVKGFSFPEVKLVGGNNVAVAAPAYLLKGTISTGLNTINTVQVIFQGEVQYSFEAGPDDELYEMPLEALVFLGNLEPGEVYPIHIVVTDNMGQESTTIVNVRKSTSIKKPNRILYTNRLDVQTEILIEYNDDENITSFGINFPSGVIYLARFEYNELNMVSKYIYRNIASDGTFERDNIHFFNYIEGTKQLIDIERQDLGYDEAGNLISESSLTKEASEFVYEGATTKVLSFRRSSTCSNIYYSDPFGLGENIYGEYFQTNSYMGSNTVRRQHREDYDPVLIPTYQENLPPFHDAVSSVLFTVFQDILYNKYMMTKTVPTDPTYDGTYLYQPSFSYETDEDGNISLITKLLTDGAFGYKGKTETYAFFYN